MGYRCLGAIGLLGLATALLAVPPTAQAAPGVVYAESSVAALSWTEAAPMSAHRTAPASATLGGLVYAAGGWNSDYLCSYLNTVEAYNPATNQWSAVALMSTAREHARAAVWNGK